MNKHKFYVEMIPDGVVLTKSADEDNRLVYDIPATTFVCEDVRDAVAIGGILLEGIDWAKQIGMNIDVYVTAVK